MINLEKIKQRKKDLHLTNQELAERSGVPLGTINKIFSGATKSPKYNTMQALETVLGMYFYYDADGPYISYVKEARGSYDIHGEYTMKDYYALPDYVRAELIDGRFYYIPSPGRQHQELLGELYYFIKDYFRKKGEKGNVYLSPFDVCLDRDEKTVVQPDLCIVSQMGNLNENGLKGIPDFIAEIISNSTCLLYTSDAADDGYSVDLGGRRIIKKIFFKQKTAYEISEGLVGSEMCIRDRCIVK